MFLINPSPQAWKTVRAAILGWGSTLRLITLMGAATACLLIVFAVVVR
jgi:hypothetical protein